MKKEELKDNGIIVKLWLGSVICSHIYVEGALEAVKLCKIAFMLEDRGTPWLDDDGVLHFQVPKDWNASFVPK